MPGCSQQRQVHAGALILLAAAKFEGRAGGIWEGEESRGLGRVSMAKGATQGERGVAAEERKPGQGEGGRGKARIRARCSFTFARECLHIEVVVTGALRLRNAALAPCLLMWLFHGISVA